MLKRVNNQTGEKYGHDVKFLLFDDLNSEDAAMVQARLTRSPKGAEPELEKVYAARRAAFADVLPLLPNDDSSNSEREVLLDKLMEIASHNDASAPARRLHKDYTVGFGHKSIADCGSCTLIVEGVSMLAAKAIEDWPLYSGEELSTRAVDMSVQPIIDPIGTDHTRALLDRWMTFYRSAQEPVAAEVRRRYPRRPGEDEKAYEGAVKYRVFDITRGFLPAGSTTNLSLHMNLRQHGDKMTWLIHHPLAEIRNIGLTWQSMLRERNPNSGTFGGGAALSGVGVDGREDERMMWNRAMAFEHSYPHSAVMFGPSYDDYFRYGSYLEDAHLRQILDGYQEEFDTRAPGCVLPHFMSDLMQLHFNVNLDFGSFRDLQRHRNGVCRMPQLTSLSDFEPWYLEQLPEGMLREAKDLINTQNLAIHGPLEHANGAGHGTPMNFEAQYYVAMGQQVSCAVTYGLPAFVYVAELRSTKTVHPTLRKKIHWMVAEFEKKFPKVKMHIDREPDGWDVRRGTQTITEKK